MTAKKAQPKKRGAKSYYTGSRLAFLEQYCDKYISLRGKCRKLFWHRFFTEWWQKYPWRLQDHEEPPTDDPEKMAELALVGEDKDLKSKVEEKVRKKTSTWFSYQANVRNSSHEGGVWDPLLKRIHKQSSSKPRCHSAAQQLMHEEPKAVNEAFAKLHSDGKGMSCMERMNKRNALARQLIDTTYEDMVPELERRAKENHEQELNEWKLEFDHIEAAEDVHLARDSLFSAVHPLLKLVGRYSGCYVTLLAAAPDLIDGKPYFTTVHYLPQDKEMRVNWTEFDEQGFKDGVARPFFKYINWMEGSNSGKYEAVKPGKSMTAIPNPSTSVSPITPPTTVPITSSTAVPTSQQPGGSRKQTLTPTEDSSEDEDVDMNITDNDSSGSSVDSDHVPAKRLRTSTIITRGSKTTPGFGEATAEADVLRASPSTNNQPSDLNNPDTEAEISSVDANVPSFNVQSDLAEDVTICNAPSPRHSPAVSMDVDKPNLSPGTSDTAGINADHVRGLVTTPPVAPSQSPSRSLTPKPGPELKVPDFLIGKSCIYEYLSLVKESRFCGLLQAYITFELADRSCIRGVVPTYRRPKAVGWWSSRARPSKLPPYDSLNSFKADIVEWWVAIQPGWREIQPGKVSRVEGDWERLYQPGINGLLNIIILAYWWARILTERDSVGDETYSWFVSDVTWVLSQLTVVAREERDI